MDRGVDLFHHGDCLGMTFLRTKHLVAIAGIACLLVMGNQAFATEDAIDVVPAATLLLPYFEVDLVNANGVTTLFSVNNASAAPQLAHVTLWTDMSRPTLDFTIYLTGYDVQTVQPRAALPHRWTAAARGSQAHECRGRFNGIDENAGAFSTVDRSARRHHQHGEKAALSRCRLSCQPGSSSTSSGRFIPVDRSRRASKTPTCAAAPSAVASGSNPLGTQDNIARGYITVDVVNYCDQLVPSDIAYYTSNVRSADPEGNVIWGDFFLVNPQENFAQGETLVHIETYEDSCSNEVAGSVYTFYGRYNPVALHR